MKTKQNSFYMVFVAILALMVSASTVFGDTTQEMPSMLGIWDADCNGFTGTINITSQTGASFAGTSLDDTPLVDGMIIRNTITYRRNIGEIRQDYRGVLRISLDGTAVMQGTFSQDGVGSFQWTATKRTKVALSNIPTITSFSPTSGMASNSPLDTVFITGTNLMWVTDLKFNGTSAMALSLDNDTHITTMVPAGATTGKISVESVAGTGTSADDFTVQDPAQLEVMLDLGADYAGPLNQVQLNYNLQGAWLYSGVLPTDGGGIALLTDIRPGSYTLTLSGSHWLKRIITNIDIEGVKLINASLTNGDADGDNQVNLFDFVVLDINFDKAHAMADLDGSGSVNLFDYVVMDTNFGAQGDAM